MCGIFGVVSDQTFGNLHTIKMLAEFNSKRGTKGFGGLSIDQGQEIIFRYDQPYSEDLYVPYGKIILGHLLSPTGNAERIHPFETDRFTLAHNGILLSPFMKEWYTGPVDTQYLVGAIQFYLPDMLKAIIEANKRIEGQRACWLWDRQEKDLYVWRVMSPLYVRIQDSLTLFSSVGLKNSEMLQEGVVYKISPGQVQEKAPFEFYSPYIL